MSPTEAFIGVAGLAIGYWLVSLYIDGSKAKSASPESQEKTDDRTSPPGPEHSADDETAGQQGARQESEWWEILGVSQHSSEHEVRSAHKRLISLCHPDRVAHLSKELQFLATKQAQELNSALSRYESLASRDS